MTISIEQPRYQPTNAETVKSMLFKRLDDIDQNLWYANSDLHSHDNYLNALTAQVAARKADFLAERSLEAAIGFPIRRRTDAASYAMPVTRRVMRVGSSSRGGLLKPFAPEPELAEQDYEAAVDVLIASRNALERSPSMTATLDEEKIRDLLLVNLNSQFVGAAGGELFNGAGKTDILIRERDRNIFIAECKIWAGPKTIGSALDQLLRYVVWRDTKAALLLFIRSGDATSVITKSLAAIEQHSSYKRAAIRREEGERSDFILRAKDDDAREIRLAFLPFVLPSA